MRLRFLLPLLAAGCALPPAPLEDDVEGDVEPPLSGPCDPLPAAIASGSTAELDQLHSDALGRVVLMGGGVEVDRASQHFVEGASGGDVLVLRASGSTESYTSYFSSELALDPAPASVTTLLLDDPALAADPGVLCRIRGAEAIWLAGGDQADYLVHWPYDVRVQIADAVARGATVGGTSAGAMAFAGIAFDARLGSITSDEALLNPGADAVDVHPSPIAPGSLADTVVDTHFVAREREGRLLAFLARALEHAELVRGVGLDESTALVIEGDTFTVLTDDGATVSLYGTAGPADITGPLDLETARRAVLDDGEGGAWPFDLAALGATEISVENGVVD